MAEFQTNLISDHLEDFPQGINSGADAFSLPPKQLSFAVNATVRGNFITNRPPFNLQNIDLSGGSDFATVLSSSIFQGAEYCAPDSGQQQLIAQIGGRLFTFTPDTLGNMTMQEVTIPGDPNPDSQPVAWLKQAGRWVVIQNGISTPIFYDTGSQTSRRSELESTSQGTSDITSQPFTPALNGTMVLLMSAPYTGPVNEAIQLVEYDDNDVVSANTTYVVVAVGGAVTTYNITLKNLADAPGAIQGVGSPLVIEPANIGTIASISSQVDGPPSQFTAIMSNPIPSGVASGVRVTINGKAIWTLTGISAGRDIIRFQSTSTTAVLPDLALVGAAVFLSSGTAPSVVVGNLAANFTAPAVGATVVTQLTSAYTNVIGQVLFINGKQYKLTAYNPVFIPGGTNNVTLQNINDSRSGHQFNTGIFPAQIFNFPELPVGRMMDYVQNRVWQSRPDGLSFIAGDQSGDPSGSPAYQFRDAVLKVAGNDLLRNGGFFTVPDNLGQISAIRGTAQLDAALGQGPVMIVCPRGVFSNNAPSDRSLWATLTTPIVSESLIGLGGLSQNSTIVVNGDLMFRAVDGIRSLIMARRDFWSWGNAPISFEMKRVIDADNPGGLPFTSAVQFDNRMLMGCIPTQGPQGVYCQGLIALNFDPISSVQGKGASVYDGLWTGLNVLQVIEGMFSGVHRCFAFTYSATEGKIQIYEILKAGNLDNGTTPITWSFETPVLFRDPNIKKEFDLISVEDGEIYVKDIAPGEIVDFRAEFRPDFSSCWYPWHEFTYCNDARSTVPIYGDRLGLGRPPALTANRVNMTSANFGRWFQQRFTINGHCIFMGGKISAAIQPQTNYARVIPSTPARVSITTLYENSIVTSGSLCAVGTLTFGGTLPRWMSIANNQILGAKGYFVGYTQDAANQAAMTALCDFIAANSALFACTL